MQVLAAFRRAPVVAGAFRLPAWDKVFFTWTDQIFAAHFFQGVGDGSPAFPALQKIAERHAAVLGSLQRTAKTSQQAIQRDLAADKARGGIEGWTSHWIINSVVVKGTVAAIRALAEDPRPAGCVPVIARYTDTRGGGGRVAGCAMLVSAMARSPPPWPTWRRQSSWIRTMPRR